MNRLLNVEDENLLAVLIVDCQRKEELLLRLDCLQSESEDRDMTRIADRVADYIEQLSDEEYDDLVVYAADEI